MQGNLSILIFSSVLINIAFIVMGYLIGSLNTSIILGKIIKKDPREEHSQNAGATNSSRVFGRKIGIIILLVDIAKTIVAVAIATGFAYLANITPQLRMPAEIAKTPVVYQAQPIVAVPMLAGFGVVLGHCFPVFYGFKGGKGVACSIGLIISYNIVLLPIAAVFFFAVAFWKKYVSLASMVAAILLIPFVFVPWMSNSVIAWGTNFNWLNNIVNDAFVSNPVHGQVLPELKPWVPVDQKHLFIYIFNYTLTIGSIFNGFIYLGAVGLILLTHRTNIKRLISGTERKINLKKS
ncbi:glycerol-3-phosphate 1-O-acyltransferase PlsY [Mycoplasmopsis verecunda]|uniref:Glycerol-3-phosphate acyltransferase n=1 Tax=Mycoplasmopsis verecunda TaxID=171291 RepID=A0A1T4LTN2_9BACT|nr:glycerol-3-phosphate 1-O-acyltransferase PlsY [Mycoplasmopsis verecunda]WPB54563.1 glycerol-3-phosphate 1-O-acyltransferase PlsY [Mycoplasmopsis verecunda]SJZ57976.1 Glycerol-3-phosphate acyltransferase [Mycoplasmopsis verecunda]